MTGLNAPEGIDTPEKARSALTRPTPDRLLVAAASTVGDAGFERSQALIDAGVDMVVIDTAHGHSEGVARAVERIKKLSNTVQVIAGNVATAEATRTLIGAGCNPNVAAVVVIGIEDGWTKKVVDGIATTGKPVVGFGIEGHGDHDTILRASKGNSLS